MLYVIHDDLEGEKQTADSQYGNNPFHLELAILFGANEVFVLFSWHFVNPATVRTQRQLSILPPHSALRTARRKRSEIFKRDDN
jgi:hypothetical protein